MSPEGQTTGVRREARRQWKITEMPPVNAQSLGLIELGFLRVDSVDRNQILSKIRSRSGLDRCIWHANRGKSNQLSNQSNVLSINQSHHGTISKASQSWFNSQECQSTCQSTKSIHVTIHATNSHHLDFPLIFLFFYNLSLSSPLRPSADPPSLSSHSLLLLFPLSLTFSLDFLSLRRPSARCRREPPPIPPPPALVLTLVSLPNSSPLHSTA